MTILSIYVMSLLLAGRIKITSGYSSSSSDSSTVLLNGLRPTSTKKLAMFHLGALLSSAIKVMKTLLKSDELKVKLRFTL